MEGIGKEEMIELEIATFEETLNHQSDLIVMLIRELKGKPSEAMTLLAMVATKVIMSLSPQESWEGNAEVLKDNVISCLDNATFIRMN